MKRNCMILWCAIAMVGCGDSAIDVGDNTSFVCGMDGRTYELRDADDKDVRHRGRCDKPLECDGPSGCPGMKDACVLVDGVSGGSHAVCVPGPITCACPAVYEPVCGADGNTYGNECEAHCAGVEVARAGPCDDPNPTAPCVRGGCSGQLCLEEGADIVTTCEFRPVYECYQQATCERQQNGQCGFTPTNELVECLEGHGMGMCEVDPAWQTGFEADCVVPDLMLETTVRAFPEAPIGLGVTFAAKIEIVGGDVPFVLREPVNGPNADVTLSCDGDEVIATSESFGVKAVCRNLRPVHSGGCQSDSDCPPGHRCGVYPPEYDGPVMPDRPTSIPFGICIPQDNTCTGDHDCPDGEFCQFGAPPTWPEPWIAMEGEGADEIALPPLPEPIGMCIDRCALILCAPGYFCDGGECIPGGCPEIYAPVCGVDGMTYSNECEAQMAGVDIAYQGECGSVSCDNNRDCQGSEDIICYPPTNMCQPRCDISCLRYEPVCGEDGVTYPCGEQSAWCNGVEVVYPGECEDSCAVVDCAPGYECRLGECIPTQPCPDGQVLTPQGTCEPKCYGPQDCGDEERCNVNEVCLQDPACPECDVCVGWCDDGCPAGQQNNGGGCEPSDCRSTGCADPDATCEECAGADGGSKWTCLGPNQGACEPPPGDCRSEGCEAGRYCDFCWFEWACIPEGAVC